MTWLFRMVLTFLAVSVLQSCGGSSGGRVITYTVGGTVTGLSGGTLVLQNNGADSLSLTSNGNFTFNTRIANGKPYLVSVRTHPSGQFCEVTGGNGTVDSANINYVRVNCASICVQGTGAATNISGRVTFDLVPHKVNGGLDYNNISQVSVKGALVEARCNGTALDSVSTDINGNYSLNIPANTQGVFVRVKAQMQQSGTPSWNFRVVDNTSGKALYAMDSSLFNTDSGPVTLDLNAASGWDGSRYSSTRVAAPFAILDSVYVSVQKVLGANPNSMFPALDINWSVNNVAVSGNAALGQIQTSHFDGAEIYLLGAVNDDTDEYDDHVIIHEWGHYFEHNFSRADNIGGDHTTGNILDIRVAFGEGFGNAWSAMASDDPIYADSNGQDQFNGLRMNLENNTCTNAGWYSECSVQSVLYDLYDVANDDTVALGFLPIYNVLTNEQKNTPALTSIFSFVYALKLNNSADSAAINSLLSAQSIDGSLLSDIYGTGQVTNNSGSSDALPVYKSITAGGAAVNVCSSDEFQVYNGYEVSRFLKFTLATQRSLTIVASRSSGTGSDPDMILWRNGALVDVAESTVLRSETMVTPSLSAGDYVLEVYDYGNKSSGVGSTCYNVSM